MRQAGSVNQGPGPAVLVVDVANVMGSRPDGWWRDRAGAAARLLTSLADLPGRQVDGPDGEPLTVARVVGVVEGAARSAAAPPGVEVVRAPADGDTTIAGLAGELASRGRSEAGTGSPRPRAPIVVVVVTADRGLRARLPGAIRTAGPRWLLGLLDRPDPRSEA
jgi:hypothetical protein